MRTEHFRASSFDGAPVQAVDLDMRQKADAFLVWSEWCHPPIFGPVKVVISLPGRRGSLPATVDGTKRGLRAMTPRCDGPGTRSTLSVDRFEPRSDAASVIRYYYGAINQRHYGYAYDYLAATGRPSQAQLSAGYATTAHVTIDTMATAPYFINRGHYKYTCVGIHLTARHKDGSILRFGGWYMTRETSSTDATIYLPGSQIRLNGALITWDRPTCKGLVR